MVPTFDWRRLQRSGIDEHQLPPGSVARPRPVTFWTPYRRYAAAALAVVVVKTALITGLLLQRKERRRAEGACRDSEARHRDVVEAQTELICRFLPDTTLTFVNDAYCRFRKKTREDLVGTTCLAIVPPYGRDAVRRRIGVLADHPGVVSYEHEVLLPAGGVGWQHWVNRALVDANGRVQELHAIGRDIPERRRAEDPLWRDAAVPVSSA